MTASRSVGGSAEWDFLRFPRRTTMADAGFEPAHSNWMHHFGRVRLPTVDWSAGEVYELAIARFPSFSPYARR